MRQASKLPPNCGKAAIPLGGVMLTLRPWTGQESSGQEIMEGLVIVYTKEGIKHVGNIAC